VTFHRNYTVSRFHYEHDPVYNTKALAGVPKHIYQGELMYQHPSGFYIAANTEASFTKYAVDYADTFFAPSYATFGARVGLFPTQDRMAGILELQNPADRRYASIVSPNLTAG
jgi:iron complex outermembrane receptor protein